MSEVHRSLGKNIPMPETQQVLHTRTCEFSAQGLMKFEVQGPIALVSFMAKGSLTCGQVQHLRWEAMPDYLGVEGQGCLRVLARAEDAGC